MESPDNTTNFQRRSFLKQTVAITTGIASVLSLPQSAQADELSKDCWTDERIDGIWNQYGHMRVVNVEENEMMVAVPVEFSSPESRSVIDFTKQTPTIRLDNGIDRITLTPKGVSFKENSPEEKWSNEIVRKLLDTLVYNESLQREALALRLAVYATYPEYLMRSKAVAPKRIVAQQQKTAKEVAAFGMNNGVQQCVEEIIVENVTRIVTRTEDVILSAASQLARCLEDCASKYPPKDIFNLPAYTICSGICLTTSFVDVVTGTVEVLRTVVEAVERKVITCTLGTKPGFFPSPFEGLIKPPSFVNLATDPTPPEPAKFSPDVIKAARGVLKDLLDSLDAISCIVNGEWKVITLSDLLIEVPGLASTPVTVSVCMDRDCALKLLGAGGGSAVGLISFLISVANPVTIGAAVTAAGISAALAPVVIPAVLLLLSFLIILLTHFIIVAGQIFMLELAGVTSDGICITQPSLPVVAAATVVNPILGILALANTPLVVTPR